MIVENGRPAFEGACSSKRAAGGFTVAAPYQAGKSPQHMLLASQPRPSRRRPGPRRQVPAAGGTAVGKPLPDTSYPVLLEPFCSTARSQSKTCSFVLHAAESQSKTC